MRMPEGLEYNYNEAEIHNLSQDEQREEMLNWFYSRYEDPVHSCPWIDGKYEFIYGGPYDAREIIESEFGNLISSVIIDIVTEELNCECYDWSPKRPVNWYDNYDIDYINAFLEDNDAFQTFEEAIGKTLSLLKAQCNEDCKDTLLKMIYANVITNLETYLSETFIKNLFNKDEFLINFLVKNKELSDKKYTLAQINSKEEFVNKEVKEYLSAIMWHNLAKVSTLFKDTFGITFPKAMKDIYKAINTRHDIVHRNGKTTSGEIVNVLEKDVQELADNVKDLVNKIEEQVNPPLAISELC